MIWICGWKILIFTVLTLCIDFVSTSSKECSITEHKGVYYSTNASSSHGKLLKTFGAESKEECQEACCSLGQCNFLMYSTVLKDEERSANKTCFLLHCAEILKCKTKKVPSHMKGDSFIGIKQENFTTTSFNDTNSTHVEQHKIYKPPSNATEHASEANTTDKTLMQNTKNIPNFNETHSSSALDNNITLQSGSMHSSTRSTFVPSNPAATIHNTSYPALSLSGQEIFFNNSSYLPSRMIPSKTFEMPVNFNHSSTPMHDTNQSRLSMLIHSTTLHTHSLGSQPRSNGSSSHVAQLSGSRSNVNNGSQSSRYRNHTVEKILDTLSMMSISADPRLNSMRSKPDTEIVASTVSAPSTFVYTHYKTEVLSLRTMSSHVSGDKNVSNTSSRAPNGAHKTRKTHPKQQIHTTRVSLVISLIIGILFFGTVVFLIGRRWSEQCFRRGYSRVDYLLNDYD